MVNEAYCSFEVSKLLKEKGFDSDEVGCHGGFYSEKCYEYGHGVKTQSGQEVGIVYDDLTNSDLEYDEYLRPTLQMAMKWLRKVHNLFVFPFPKMNTNKFWVEIYQLSDNQEWENLYCESIDLQDYSTYEEAVEAALKYSLENLF